MTKLSTKLLPLIEKKQVYCIIWSDIRFTRCSDILDSFEKHLQDNSYLHSQVFSMCGRSEHNNLARPVNYFFKPLIKDLFKGKLKLQKPQKSQKAQKLQKSRDSERDSR